MQSLLPTMVHAKRKNVAAASFMASMVTKEMMWNVLENIPALVKSYREISIDRRNSFDRLPFLFVSYPLGRVNVTKICKRIDLILVLKHELVFLRSIIYLLKRSDQGHEWLEQPSL